MAFEIEPDVAGKAIVEVIGEKRNDPAALSHARGNYKPKTRE
jgi:hypothetical protein